jgi:hypothetical protein
VSKDSESGASFWELYKHPKWQQRRLQVLSRAEWQCDLCEEADTELHVHHKLYIKGRKPWEYDDDQLEALCKNCHSKTTDLDKEIKRLLGVASNGDKAQLLGYLRVICLGYGPDYDPCVIDDGELAMGAADCCHVYDTNIIDLVRGTGELHGWQVAGIQEHVINAGRQRFTTEELQASISARVNRIRGGGI